MSYHDQMLRFYDGMADAGRMGEPFDAAMERVAAEEDIDVNDGTILRGKQTWARARVMALPWRGPDSTGVKTSAAVTSGGTRVLLTITPGLPGVTMDEVTPDGEPWRRVDVLVTASQLIDKWGLVAP